MNLWFDYPIHLNDESGVLADIDPEMEMPSQMKAREARKKSAEEKRKDKRQKFENAVANANMGEPPTVKDIAEYLSSDEETVTPRKVRDWVKEFGYTIDKNAGNIIVKAEDDEE